MTKHYLVPDLSKDDADHFVAALGAQRTLGVAVYVPLLSIVGGQHTFTVTDYDGATAVALLVAAYGGTVMSTFPAEVAA